MMLAGMRIGVKRCEKRRRALFGSKNAKVALFMRGKMKTNTVVNMVVGLNVGLFGRKIFLKLHPLCEPPSKQ